MKGPATFLFLLLAVAAASPGEARPWIGWDLRCDSQELRLDDPRHAWRLISGFAGAAAPGGRVIAGEATALILLGDPRGEETIFVEARTDRRRTTLAAELNGRPLGEREVRRRLDSLAYAVPPGAARRGVNLLRLTASAGRGRSEPVTVERIGVGPLRCRGEDPAALAVDGGEPLTLSRRSLVLVPLAPGADERLRRLDIALRTARQDTAVDVSCWTDEGIAPVARLTGGRHRRARAVLPLDGECAAARGLAVLGQGPGPARRVRIDVGPAGGLDWRRRAGLETALSLLALLVAAVAFAARLRTGRRPAPASAAAAWRDFGWLTLIALAPRAAFWAIYPHPGEAADSYEYLLRAGFLAYGSADFWSDLEWHSWGRFVRPPGYFALLALFDAPQAAGRLNVIGLQMLLSALTAGLTYLLTLPLFGRLAAWCAGLFFAFYLGSVATFTRILAEPLFIFLIVAALSCLAWLARRPAAGLALGAGALFGLAALVRPGPIYYPLVAALLLLPALGWRRSLRSGAALLVGLAAVTLPWSLRNSLIAGHPVGVETVSVANLLLAHPDERVLPLDGLDLGRPEDRIAYRARIHRLDPDQSTSRKMRHVGHVLRGTARDPAAQARRVGANLRQLLGPAPDAWLQWILAEGDVVRVARLTALLNHQYGLLLLLAAAGLALLARRPGIWPIAAWFFFNTLVVTFFFFSALRFREPTTPVLMALAGGAVAALVDRLGVVEKSSLS